MGYPYKIGLLIPAFLRGTGGAEKIAHEVAKIIIKNGHKATIICNPKLAKHVTLNLSREIEIIEVNINSDRGIREIKCEFDVIIGFAMSGFFKRILSISEIWNTPFIIQECTNPNRMIASIFINQQDGCKTLEDAFWIRQTVFSKASAIRLTAPAYESTVHPQYHSHTYPFYNSFEPSEPIVFRTLRKNIISVGGMKNSNKNGMVAAQSFARFAAGKQGWKFIQYGKNNFKKELRELRNIYPDVRLLDYGIEQNVDKIYNGAYGLVIPSYEEGLPNVVVEAFTYGIPCIGYSDCEGVNHLIKDNENGFLIDRKNPEAMVIALNNLADEEVRSRLSRNASKFARESFRKRDFEHNWMNVIQSALRQNSQNL
ncbi:glycosyltransferase [Sneathiella marina]|uniref:Glycosyltransferase n=1 Tax=Sneathiella marina TaxID=2950108 RepID=A0ABY4W6Z7_9PROT|nr:glycosyltransferase [Sneathiella marina]USG62808.1 glycosyltransferase [Sneathiella marina]